MDFFKYTNGEIVFLKDELMRVYEFRKLLAMDKGSVNDSQGKKKLEAMKWCLVIYWRNHPLSPGIQKGYSGDELLEDAINECNLPKDWTPNLTFLDAEKRYSDELFLGSTYIKLYKSQLRSFKNSDKIIEVINSKISDKLEQPTLTTDELAELITLQDKLIKMADGMPKRIKDFKESEILMFQALEDKEFAQGGLEVEDSMDDSKSIRYGSNAI